ncbi:MAG: hypothetical protein Q8R96_20765 [Bacteroidota bacterium]|nr:hypothetical protein [Bacteroidota bacterium]
MTTLKVNIDNQSDARALATFLRTLGYVKSVSIEKPLLTDEDWIMPGRAATDKELDRLIDELEKDNDPGISTAQLEKEIAQWSKGIYR